MGAPTTAIVKKLERLEASLERELVSSANKTNHLGSCKQTKDRLRLVRHIVKLEEQAMLLVCAR